MARLVAMMVIESARPCALNLVPQGADLTFAEFFAGIGLIRLGLERQGRSVAFANDIDPRKYAMYQGHFEGNDRLFVFGDVRDLRAEQIPTVTLATASFPCNDLSLAGARRAARSAARWSCSNA